MTTQAAIENEKVIALRSEAAGLLDMATGLEVTEATVKDASDLLSWIKANKTRLEAERTSLVKPLNNHVKFINDRFREWTNPLDEADRTVREKVVSYQQEQRRIAEEARRAEEARIAEERRKQEEARVAAQAANEPEPEPEPVAPAPSPDPPKTTHSALGAMTSRQVWDFEIERPELIPRAFLMVNEQAIRAAVKAGSRDIPGVRIFQRDGLAVRAR